MGLSQVVRHLRLHTCNLNIVNHIHETLSVVIVLCVLSKTTQTPIKYSSGVPAAGTLAKWNPFLLNRKVIRLIAVLVLN